MRHPLAWVSLLLLLVSLLGGCGGKPTPLEAAMTRAQSFMRAQTAGEAGAVWNALTSRGQRSISRARVARYLEQEQITFAGLGEPVEIEPGLVRVPVFDLVTSNYHRTLTWPESWLTLIQEGDRWRVAWAEPLFADAAQAFHNGRFVDQLSLARSILAIDPHHYRGYLELHYAYRGLQRYREAELALVNAAERATRLQQPDVYDATARFKLALNQPSDALAYAQKALELAAPYIPETYTLRWQADTLVFASRTARALGDHAAADSLIVEATQADPTSPAIAIYRYELETAIPVSGH